MTFTLAPTAFYVLCQLVPGFCAPTPGIATVPYSIAVSVDKQVNRRIIPRTERGDTWTINPKKYGDCEEFAIEKRQMLLAKGYASNATRQTP